MPREERPRYLLILGDLDGVSLEFQQIVGADAFVGRVAFPTLDDDGAYAEKILQWEAQPSPEAAGRAMFYTVRDGTSATSTGARLLMSPLFDSCTQSQENGTLRASEVIDLPYEYGVSDPAGPLVAAVSDKRPGLLFTMSHGLGPPRGGFDSPLERRAL